MEEHKNLYSINDDVDSEVSMGSEFVGIQQLRRPLNQRDNDPQFPSSRSDKEGVARENESSDANSRTTNVECVLQQDHTELAVLGSTDSASSFSWQRPTKTDLNRQLSRSLITDCEDAEGEDSLLLSLDRLEDEIDTHTADLLPLSVRLALEQNLFCFSHLASDMLVGHVLYVSGVSLLTYYLISWIGLSNSRHPILGQKTFCAVRTTLTIISAVLTFRTIRRRRFIWLRSAYGTQAYERDTGRRDASVIQVDKTTLLGRIRNTVTEKRVFMRTRRASRKLRKASKRFERNHLRRHENQRGGTFLVSSSQQQQKTNELFFSNSYDSHEQPVAKSILQDQVLIPEINILPYAHGGFFGAAPFMLFDPIWVNILRELMPDVYVEIAQRIFAPTQKLIHWAENNPVVAAYGTVYEQGVRGRAVTLEWDVFLDPYLVNNLQLAVEQAETSDARSDDIKAQLNEKVQIATLTLLEKMMIAHGSTLQLLVEQTGWWKHFNFSRIKRQRRTLGGGMYARQWLEVYAHALHMAVLGETWKNSGQTAEISGSCSSEESTEVSSSSEDDNLGAESTSLISSQFQPDNGVASTRSKQAIEKGGRFIPMLLPPRKHQRTISLSSAALLSSINMVESLDMIKRIMHTPITLVLDLKSRHVPKRVWALVVDALRDCGACVEGVASFIPNEIRGIFSICSLPVNEIYFFHSAGDFQQACHTNQLRPGDTIFFNAGSLLWTAPPTRTFCDWVKLAKSCIVDFNVEETKRQYALQPYARMPEHNGLNNATVSNFPFTTNNGRLSKCEANSNACQIDGCTCQITIADYKAHYRLNIGIYCQEFAIDDAAVDLIIRFVNAYPDIFNLGMSWGGVNGLTVKGIQPGRLASTDGFWNQRYIGASWDYNLRPG